jgi:hypothetical protein
MALAPARLHTLEKYKFDPFSMAPMDRMAASISVQDPRAAVARLEGFLGREEMGHGL